MRTLIAHNRKRQPVATAIVDDSAFATLSLRSWHLKGGYFYTNLKIDGVWRYVSLHKLVVQHFHPEWLPLTPGHRIDHANRNRLDCRIENLRIVTHSINARNAASVNRSSGFRCVFYSQGTWQVQIRVGGRLKSFGRFKDKAEAARRVNEVYRLHFPELETPNPQVAAA